MIKRLARSWAAAALVCSVLWPASGQTQDNEWSFRLTPYGWVASMALDTSIGASPPASSETDLLDILDFAFLLAGEARKGDWGLIGEFNYLALSDEFTFPGGRVSGKSKLRGFMGGAAVAYRFAGDDRASADVFGGFRIWSLEATATFPRLPAFKRKTTFVDPIIGLRGTYFVTEDIFLSGLVEIGGFGAGSDFQWEALGRVSYRFNDTVSAGLGYRYLALDLSRGSLAVDAAMSGPFIAFDINF